MAQRIDRHTVKINGNTIGDLALIMDYIKKIRASYYLLGALLKIQESRSSTSGRMQYRKQTRSGSASEKDSVHLSRCRHWSMVRLLQRRKS